MKLILPKMQETIPFNNFFLIFLLFVNFCFAQVAVEMETGLTAHPMPEIKESIISAKAKVNSLSLPFEDDFSDDKFRLNYKFWEDSNVYINNSMAIDPINYGVATFDGLNKFGQPYDEGNLNTDTADILTSKPINLSNTIGTTIFRFYFQPAGWGEAPSNDDSLSIYFFSPSQQKWHSVWRQRGSGNKPFELVQLVIDSSIFLQDNFQFRFISYGSGAGAFDVWHIDRVRLEDQTSLQDTTFKEPSFTINHPSLLKKFTAVPWFHYSDIVANSINKSSLQLNYRRNVETGSGYSIDLGSYEISFNNQFLSRDLDGVSGLDPNNPNIINTYVQPIKPFPLPSAPTGEFQIDAWSSYFGLSGVETDTLYHTQYFKNYYAYDDGTAERAYRITDNEGGFIVSRFELLTDLDSTEFKGLYVYFSPGINDISQNKFSIVVFEDINGIPGDLIYESDSLYTPQFTERNFYLPYALDSSTGPVNVKGHVHIGIRQQKKEPLNLGFDKNNVIPTATFYGNETNFSQSFLQGTVMMRPFFEYLPYDISIKNQILSENQMEVYPNPASERIFIEADKAVNEILHFQLFNLSGQSILKGNLIHESVDISLLPNGVYILQLTSSIANRQFNTKKIIIAR